MTSSTLCHVDLMITAFYTDKSSDCGLLVPET
jgi:hypothetical protein